MQTDVLIIGGGLGGLFTGAILAKEGRSVTLVEKNATLGGGLQSFRRWGEWWDTGMHVIAGMQPGGSIRRICDYLGVTPQMHIRNVDDQCADAVYIEEDRQWYRIAQGKQGFVNSLAAYFPAERQNLERYVRDIYAITDELTLFSLRPQESYIPIHSDSFAQYADDFIADHFQDPRLRAVVAYMNPLYGGRAHQTPAFVHAIIHVLYIEGCSRFVDNSQHFADVLAGVIEQYGGRIVKGDAVTHVEVENRMVTGVDTRKGLHLTADTYVSAIHPCALFPLLSEGALPRAYRNRLDGLPNAYSAFSLYIKLKPGTFPFLNHSEYCMSRYDQIWQFGRHDMPWPLGFLIMTPPESGQSAWANKVLVTAPMDWSHVERWEHTSTGRRGDDYEQWKQKCTRLLLQKAEEMHPGFGQCVEHMLGASPLTIRDFFGSKEGTLCGFSKDAHNLAASQVPVVTKVRNLLLTGQNINLHGFCGVPLTAITTAEAILGRNYVIDKINHSER